MIGLFALMLGAAILLLLPLLPALVEWLRPSDAAPLHVADNRRYLAAKFQHLVEAQLRPLLEQAQVRGDEVEAVLPSGGAIIALPDGHSPYLDALGDGARKTSRLVLGAGDLTLPHDYTFSNTVYAGGSLSGGPGLVLHAVLAKGDIDLGEGTHVRNWVRADGTIEVEKNSRLHGRASAGQRLLLGPGCKFSRLDAPRIETSFPGLENTPLPATDPASFQPLNRCPALQAPGYLQVSSTGRWRVHGDLSVTEGTWHRGDLVASADLSIGANAFVAGAVKGNRDVLLGAGSRVCGSVVATRRVVMRQDSQTLGPIIAEEMVEIGTGCVVGAPGRPTTVSAPHIRLSAGALVYGALWAHKEGQVLP